MLSGTGMDFAYLCPKEYFWSEQNSGLKKFGPRTFWPTKIEKLGPKSLVKIGPVTAEILLIWTNVTTAYMLPGQMSQ